MLLPPAASWSVAQDRRWQGVHAVLWACAVAALVVWLQQRAQLGSALASQPHPGAGFWGVWALGGLACVAAAAGGWRMGHQPAGCLTWSGSQWSWAEAGGQSITVTPQVMMDLGGWLLLHMRRNPPSRASHSARIGLTAGPIWLSVRGPREPSGVQAAPWAAFRAAVYSFGPRTRGPTDLGNPSF